MADFMRMRQEALNTKKNSSILTPTSFAPPPPPWPPGNSKDFNKGNGKGYKKDEHNHTKGNGQGYKKDEDHPKKGKKAKLQLTEPGEPVPKGCVLTHKVTGEKVEIPMDGSDSDHDSPPSASASAASGYYLDAPLQRRAPRVQDTPVSARTSLGPLELRARQHRGLRAQAHEARVFVCRRDHARRDSGGAGRSLGLLCVTTANEIQNLRL